MVKTAVIMAGGLGTRLGSLTQDIPKPMLEVAGKPFLDYLIKNVIAQGIDKLILSVSYKSEKIIEFCQSKYKNLDLKFSIEQSPLGTGGGLRKALELVDEETVLVLNGDTYSNFDLKRLNQFYDLKKADVVLVLKYKQDASRYGIVELNSQSRIIRFSEKRLGAVGFINSGVSLVKKSCLAGIDLDKVFSFESDFLAGSCQKFNFYGIDFPGYFIDIGIIADFNRAQEEFKNFIN